MTNSILHSKRILITVGPTQEAIDPVRFISNHSTGKMGYAIREKLHSLGAIVRVVSGPTNVKTSLPKELITNVVSADEMLVSTQKFADDVDIIIFSAAVRDYKCVNIAGQKIKKSENSFLIELVPNPDIAFELSKNKRHDQTFIGFALETENGVEHAISKMKKKKFDSVVLNIQKENGVGFGYDTNRIQIIDSDTTITNYALKLKSDVAADIVNHIEGKLKANLNMSQLAI